MVWSEVQASGEGDFKKVPAGAYMGKIVGMRDVPEKEFVTLLFDIAEGDYAGFYSDAFYADKEWAHSMTLSYKDKALGMTKGRLETVAACNPGFDPFAAWDAQRLDMFLGRAVGLVFREEEYYDRRTGEFKVGSARCFRFCRREELGGFGEVAPKTLDHDGRVEALRRAGFGEYEAESEARRLEYLASAAGGARQAPARAASADAGVPF